MKELLSWSGRVEELSVVRVVKFRERSGGRGVSHYCGVGGGVEKLTTAVTRRRWSGGGVALQRSVCGELEEVTGSACLYYWG